MQREKTGREKKVAELIQKEVAKLVQREFRDPRLGMVTINEVRVSRIMLSLTYISRYSQRIAPRMQNCCLMKRVASLDLN